MDTTNKKLRLKSGEGDFNENFTKKQYWLAWLVYIPLFFGLPYILAFIAGIMGRLTSLDTSLLLTIINSIFPVVMVVVGIFLFKDFLTLACKSLGKWGLKKFVLLTTLGWLGGVLCNIIGTLLALLLDGVAESQNQMALELLVQQYPISMIITTAIITPIIEELAFRGIIYRTLRKCNVLLAIIMSGFLFGFIHVVGAVILGDFKELIQIIPYFFLGIYLAALYEKTKSIAVPIYIHMLINTVAMAIIIFRPIP